MWVLLILSLLFIFGLLLLFNLWSANRAPSRRKRRALVQEIRQDMDKWAGELIPLDREELELFSPSQQKNVLRKGVGMRAKGVFTTIFQEPVLAYSYRRFLGKKVNDLLYARTAKHEYVYWTRNGETTLEIDGQEVGRLAPEGVLYGRRTGREIARLQAGDTTSASSPYLPILVGDKEVASLSTKDVDPKGLQEKAFAFLRDDLDEKEQHLLLSLAARALVLRTVEKAG